MSIIFTQLVPANALPVCYIRECDQFNQCFFFQFWEVISYEHGIDPSGTYTNVLPACYI